MRPRYAQFIFCACVAFAWGLSSPRALLLAQQVAAARDLPDAPDAFATVDPDAVPGTATLAGKVTDSRGTAIPGATIRLTAPGVAERNLISDDQGLFTFRAVAPGAFSLTVSGPGLQTFTLPSIHLAPNQTLALPPIALTLVGGTAVVRVTATPTEIAQAQVQLEEKQRVFGVFPNFYVSFVWDAARLNARQKFGLATHSVFDPIGFAAIGLVAGTQQAANTYGQYGQGAEGYAKRYGADYADVFIGRMLSSAILPSLLHQDPRYFYKGAGGVRHRAVYALSRVVITRGDDGRPEFDYSRIVGDFGAGAISNAYHPSNDRGIGLTISNGFIDLAGNAADNLLREFFSRKLTKNVPEQEQGQKSAAGPDGKK